MSDNLRETELTVELGGEQVEFVSITAHETLSELFEFELEIAAPLGELDLGPHLGKPVTIKVLEHDAEVRFFNGLLVEGMYLRESADGFCYSLSLRPQLYFLDTQVSFAIFQDKSIVDIIKEVLAAAGISGSEFRLAEKYEKVEYCVQYGESDLQFVSRLMEQEGLYYFFEHGDGKHTLVVCDSAREHKPSSVTELAFNPTSKGSLTAKASADWGNNHFLLSWTERVKISGTKAVSLRDFDFTKPDQPVEGKATEASSEAHDKQRIHGYPGVFLEEGRANHISKVRLEQKRAERRVFTGDSTAKGLTVGSTVKVAQHPNSRYNAEYMIVSTVHVLQAQAYRSGAREQSTDNVHFVVIPSQTQYRPPLKTEKPRVVGVESAIVTGPSGETIYTDEYGRVKVRFHWDRAGLSGEETTCWIRVSQTGGLGNVVLPRVGHEVLVNFLNGDPDRPVVMGRVFNKSNMPVYDLPANKTMAVWRSLTYGQQGQYPQTQELDTKAPQANELRFEDKGGEEEVLLHAERFMNLRTRFDYSNHIGHNAVYEVGYDRQQIVKNDESVEVTDGNRSTEIKKGNDKLELGMGDLSIKAKAGKVTINAAQSIELKCGQSSIKLTPGDVTMKSPMITINGEATTTVKAGAMTTIKGGIVKIN